MHKDKCSYYIYNIIISNYLLHYTYLIHRIANNPKMGPGSNT